MPRILVGGANFTEGSGVITVPNAAAFQSLTAFTVECYLTTKKKPTATFARIVDYSASNFGFAIYYNNATTNLAWNALSSANNSLLTMPVAIRTHIAIVWDGTKSNIFVGGVKDSVQPSVVAANSGNPAQAIFIGNGSAGTNGSNTVIECLRISNNARYTATFTPPVGALAVDANTIELFNFAEGTGSTTKGVNGNIGTLSGTPVPTLTARTVAS